MFVRQQRKCTTTSVTERTARQSPVAVFPTSPVPWAVVVLSSQVLRKVPEFRGPTTPATLTSASFIEAFIEAMAKHRHPQRETDPPRI